MVEPEHETAQRYIGLIKKEMFPEEETEEETEEAVLERKEAIAQALEEAEETLLFPEEITEEFPDYIIFEEEVSLEEAVPAPSIKEKVVLKKKAADYLILDEAVWATQPDTLLEVEMGKPLPIEGNQISRFLVTVPGMLAVERITPDKIELKALNLGNVFLHIWDNQGRWTFKIQNMPALPEGPTLEEIQRQEIEKAENFKIRYSFNRDDYYLGTKLSNLERESLSFTQFVGMDGETPYGRFDSAARIAKLEETSDLSYLTMGLTKASIGGLRDFDLRGFDYNMYGSELVFPGINLRGVRFDQRLTSLRGDYTLFWGREGQGAFGRLSPGLAETKDSFLEGGRFFFNPWDNFNYQLGYYRGYGDERDTSLHTDSLDLIANFDTEHWKMSAQGGYDAENFAYLLDSVFMFPSLRIRTEYRNICPDYLTAIGRPSRLGEKGGLCLLEFSGIKNLFFTQRVDVYRDRLYPNPESLRMWNVELDSNLTYRLSEKTSLNANFRYWDEKGKISPRRDRSMGAGISQNIDLFKKNDLTFYSDYQYQKSKNFNSITSDYEKHRVLAGLRLRLLDGFSTFVSEQYSWLEELSSNERTHPRAWEAGFDYDHQVGKLPLYASLRASYRDEKDAASTYSSLADEDSVEVQGELSYRPVGDWEIFVNARLRKVWPEILSESNIYTEGEFITGARLRFDTGVTWNPVGDIYGEVFKDIDGDGLREEGEPGIEGIKIFLGKEKFCTSDEEGSFSFPKVRAKKAYLNLDLSTAPSGFVPSSATFQEVSIKQGGISTANFGLTFRCEIVGNIFLDTNGNGKFDPDEAGLADVVLHLEDGSQTRTNDKGQFHFRKVSVGEHELSFDVNTVPIHLLPKVPIKKRMFLDEGMSYIYNIPLEPLK